MRNLEVKARCPDLETARARAEELGARAVGAFRQRDTFFAAPLGRLKLRVVDDGRAELIAYRRADASRARESEYLIYRSGDAFALHAVLAHALGPAGVVEKRRRLYLYGHTRIHLDEVRELGTFVELETVLEGQPEAEARAELASVVAALGLRDGDLVAGAYVDLPRNDA
jgi:predicted adenylyl cyclase CyaB